MGQVADDVNETPGQKVVVDIETPLKATGGIAILRGNLAPEGCVAKLAGHGQVRARASGHDDLVEPAVLARVYQARSSRAMPSGCTTIPTTPTAIG